MEFDVDGVDRIDGATEAEGVGPLANRSSENDYETIGQAVERLARWKGCSVVLEDAQFRLVAYSSHLDATAADMARLRTVLEKRAPEDVVAAIRRRGILKLLTSARTAVRTPALPEVGLSERVAVAVRDAGTSYGYLWVGDTDKALGDEDLRHIATFAADHILPLLIERYRSDRSRRDEAADFLKQLVSGEPADEETERRVRADFFPSIADGLHVAAVRSDGSPANAVESAWSAARRASDDDIAHVSARLNGVTYILCAPHASAGDRGETQRTGESMAAGIAVRSSFDRLRRKIASRRPNVGVGYCGPFTDFGETGLAARMASGAAFVSLGFFRGRRTVGADEYPLIIRALGPGTGSPSKLPATTAAAVWLERIVQYDEKHGTSLVRTLEQYLDEGGSVSAAAAAVQVHPNTLLYRLKRVEELADLDMRDGVQRTLVHTELKLWSAMSGR